MQWLSAPDASTNYIKALEQRHKSSGLWFLQSAAFTQWKMQPNSFLWLHGIPGCGKTILSTSAIEELEKSTTSSRVLYFYFDFTDTSKQSLEKMIRSLIKQLYEKRQETRACLDSLYSSCKDAQPTRESICSTLLDMLYQSGEVYIILDALDECNTRSGPRTKGVLSWMVELLSIEQGNVHLLVTSRSVDDIESSLNVWVLPEFKIPIQGKAVDDDIRTYIHARVKEDLGLKRWCQLPEVQREIEVKIMENSNGM
jgi:Cdc6-like AAA superfamily ATPase